MTELPKPGLTETGVPHSMAAVLLQGHGGPEQLHYREDVPVPQPGPGEVLVRVGAAGINNTDINTRVGWYSKAATTPTGTPADIEPGAKTGPADDATWGGTPLAFPRIQGIDVCGRIVAVGTGAVGTGAVGAGADSDQLRARIGERVLIEPCLRPGPDRASGAARFLGSECDGGFAQYVTVPAWHAFPVHSPWSDAELASLPCAYSTAENMLHRTLLQRGETVLISGASGGVGSAAVQLARMRGARVIAVASPAKAEAVRALGAEQVLPRDADVVQSLGPDSVDVVLDLVAGPQWPRLLDVLRPGGRYGVAGAIAGPLVTLDVRTLYLKDLTLFGCTVLAPEVFPNLIAAIERQEIRPVVAATYPLRDIARAQQDFAAKNFTGKLVLIPPQ